jgi:nucleoside-diphosphate-sugar epimerase
MKVLITGASGYFGSILCKALIEQKIQVVGLDIRRNDDGFPEEFYSYYDCSITDHQKLQHIFSKEQPTHVIHFACTFNKLRDKEKERSIDVGGSMNILRAADHTVSVKQIIYSSSAAVYGGFPDNPEWIKESHTPRPGKYTYGLNKNEIERIFLSEKRRDDLKVVITRICTLTGPSYSSERVLLKLIAKFPMPHFYKFNRIQLLHEHDFVVLMTKILNDENISGIYNMAPDSYAVINELVPDKKFFIFPKGLLKPVLWLLWNLKVVNLSPASVNTSIYPVILDPSRLKNRYDYRFRYTTQSAFIEIRNSKFS